MAGTEHPFWVLARTQSAGRGRRGRAWVPLPGNLYASLAHAADPDPARAALRSFVAALALADALDGLGVPASDIALKWPNDVLLHGRKLAGILLESTPVRGTLLLIVGIGVNLAAAPPAEALEPGAVPPVALADAGIAVTPEAFLDRLAGTYAAREDQFRRDGFAATRGDWLARAARLGQPVTARLPGREVAGVFRTVDDTGALVLDTPQGRQALPAAEVFF